MKAIVVRCACTHKHTHTLMHALTYAHILIRKGRVPERMPKQAPTRSKLKLRKKGMNLLHSSLQIGF